MKCAEAQKRIRPFLKRELPPEDLESFLQHIENCPDCYEELELYLMIQAALEEDETKDFVAKYADKTGGDVPNQFAADGYDVVEALYAACEEAGVTSDMDASDVCEAVKAVLTGGDFSYDGLTGEGMTWDASGAVSKAPRGMVIENGEYVSLDA